MEKYASTKSDVLLWKYIFPITAGIAICTTFLLVYFSDDRSSFNFFAGLVFGSLVAGLSYQLFLNFFRIEMTTLDHEGLKFNNQKFSWSDVASIKVVFPFRIEFLVSGEKNVACAMPLGVSSFRLIDENLRNIIEEHSGKKLDTWF